MCSICKDTGRIGTLYCSCPRGKAAQLKEDFAKKSSEKPDLIKRYSDFDLRK